MEPSPRHISYIANGNTDEVDCISNKNHYNLTHNNIRPRPVHIHPVMEAHMALLFRHIEGKWTLQSTDDPNTFNDTFWRCQDFAKVKFFCADCQDGWTSMYGLITFFYTWKDNRSEGKIYYYVSGQKCRQCSSNTFEVPLWYPEELQKVVTNIYYEVCNSIFGLQTPSQIRTRRLGHPSHNHATDLCQGCMISQCNKPLVNNSDDTYYQTFGDDQFYSYPLQYYSDYSQNCSSLPVVSPQYGFYYPPSCFYYPCNLMGYETYPIGFN